MVQDHLGHVSILNPIAVTADGLGHWAVRMQVVAWHSIHRDGPKKTALGCLRYLEVSWGMMQRMQRHVMARLSTRGSTWPCRRTKSLSTSPRWRRLEHVAVYCIFRNIIYVYRQTNDDESRIEKLHHGSKCENVWDMSFIYVYNIYAYFFIYICMLLRYLRCVGFDIPYASKYQKIIGPTSIHYISIQNPRLWFWSVFLVFAAATQSCSCPAENNIFFQPIGASQTRKKITGCHGKITGMWVRHGFGKTRLVF